MTTRLLAVTKAIDAHCELDIDGEGSYRTDRMRPLLLELRAALDALKHRNETRGNSRTE